MWPGGLAAVTPRAPTRKSPSPAHVLHSRGFHHHSCSQTNFSRLTCIPCFPSGINMSENIPASERANTRTALELHFPEQKKLLFLD